MNANTNHHIPSMCCYGEKVYLISSRSPFLKRARERPVGHYLNATTKSIFTRTVRTANRRNTISRHSLTAVGAVHFPPRLQPLAIETDFSNLQPTSAYYKLCLDP